MSPEAAISTHWREVFSCDYVKEHLALVAVDEAHCIVDWFVVIVVVERRLNYSVNRGCDFRTSFSKIGNLRALTKVPFMALTATASQDTQTIIMQSLKLVQPVVVSLCLDRPNIFLSVSTVQSLCVST